jgi:YtkA-like
MDVPKRICGCAAVFMPRSRRGILRVIRSSVLRGLAFAALFFLAGCHSRSTSQQDVSVEFKIAPQPARVGTTVISVQLRDAAGKPLSQARLSLEGDMAHAGMAPAFGDVKEVAAGSYEGRLDLSMPGDWVILVHGRLADGTRLERQVSVPGVQAN